MSEYQMTEIKLRPNPNGRGFRIHTVHISDIWASGTKPQLSEIQTDHPHHNTTFKCPLRGWGSGLKK